MTILKPCSYVGCNTLVEYGEKYCDKHSNTDKERYKEYKSNRLKDKDERDRQRFYNSKTWIKLRDYISANQYQLDILELYKGNVVVAEDYHHVISIKDDWNKRLDVDNIIGLSHANHMLVEAKYRRSDKDKIEMQEELLKALEWFNNTYKV